MNDYLIAACLGVVEGLTEYIPVSSTGHLIVAGTLLGFQGDKASTFEVFIQLGAILAVLVLYSERFRSLLKVGPRLEEGTFSGASGIFKVALACVPALIVGAIAHSFIKSYLFNPVVVAVSLVVGGVVLLIIKEKDEYKTESLDSISFSQSFAIGLFQLCSLCPGVSRSGATIVGGMLVGCSKKVSAEFSFIVAVPVMCAAVGYDMLKSLDVISMSDIPVFAVGFVVSFFTAILAIRCFLAFLNSYSLAIFGVYRILVGVLFFWIFTS